MSQIWSLTDKTICNVYFHARTKEGAIRFPSAVGAKNILKTPSDTKTDLGILLATGVISQQNYDECMKAAALKDAPKEELPSVS